MKNSFLLFVILFLSGSCNPSINETEVEPRNICDGLEIILLSRTWTETTVRTFENHFFNDGTVRITQYNPGEIGSLSFIQNWEIVPDCILRIWDDDLGTWSGNGFRPIDYKAEISYFDNSKIEGIYLRSENDEFIRSFIWVSGS